MNREKGSAIPRGLYEHFKGSYIEVIDVAKHSETLEDMVVYRHLDTNELWVRPRVMFEEVIERDGNMIRRFRPLERA